MNKRQKGQQNKLKIKKWLEAQGYVVENSEVNKTCYFNKRLVAVHKDLFGSDLLAINGKDIIFIQCKSVKGDLLTAEKEFKKYPFPSFVKRWAICWELRKKEPIVRKIK